ncbi:hypothetical protein TWF225_002169 [Orbilia oligospora]|nr:hypothetical protein TWF225_002169 [Orbilia oligospora]KAF3242630.1 hypothetical protein TWF217_011490 [Orbilia oligospora]KAF3257979.1 hypothetical protein TWF128_004879 [Orbilia oligospora]
MSLTGTELFYDMIILASRSPVARWGAFTQNINGPFTLDTEHGPKVSGFPYKDVVISSKTNTTFARTPGNIPDSIGSSLVSKTGFYNNISKKGTPGTLYSSHDMGLPHRHRSISKQGDIGPLLPGELALIILQGFDPMYTERYALNHKLVKPRFRGNPCRGPGNSFWGHGLPIKANYSNSFNQFIKEPSRTRTKRYSRNWIAGRPMPMGLSFIPLNSRLWHHLPKYVDLCGDAEPGRMYPEGSSKMYENQRKKSSGNASGYVRDKGREDYKRKRAVDEDEENEDANPPPSKRVNRNSPEPQALRLALACPFAKADVDKNEHAYCLFIRRKNLSGIKEHLKRNHFGNKLPVDVRAAKTWDDVFDICNPHWHPTERPSPYFETGSKRSLASSSRSVASSVKSNHPEEILTPAPFENQKVPMHNELEPCPSPLSGDGTSPMSRNIATPSNVHPNHCYHHFEGQSSTSRAHDSKRASLSTQVEQGMEASSWSIATTENDFEQRIPLEPRHMLDPNWFSTSSTLEGHNQHAFFPDDFGIASRDTSENIQVPMPSNSLITSSNHSFDNPTTVNPSHLFFRQDLQDESSLPWSRNNPVSQEAETTKRTAPVHASILNRTQEHPPYSSDTTVLPVQPTPEPELEDLKEMNQSNPYTSKGKQYLLIVTRLPQNTGSKEPRRAHRFNFENLHEFQARFEGWLRDEFTDPPFCWNKMMLFNNLEKARLENVKEVAENLEHTFIQYRSSDASLYLVSRNSHPHPPRPVTLH